MADLGGTNKTILVTGSTDGIGKETALELARQGHRVLLHGRNAARLADVCLEVEQVCAAAARPLTFCADLSVMDRVRGLADEVDRAVEALDVLINNAGVYMNARVETDDGFEMTFAVNHLAPFLLTRGLLPALRRARHARVVTVSSVAHRRGQMHWDDLQLFAFDDYRAYAQSKLANVLFSNELARRLAPAGITSNSLHPGVISTKLLHAGFDVVGASLEEGARTSVRCAVDPTLADTTGAYFRDAQLAETSAAARDEAAQRRLWTVSEALLASW